jgi:hypothetical protein
LRGLTPIALHTRSKHIQTELLCQGIGRLVLTRSTSAADTTTARLFYGRAKATAALAALNLRQSGAVNSVGHPPQGLLRVTLGENLKQLQDLDGYLDFFRARGLLAPIVVLGDDGDLYVHNASGSHSWRGVSTL